jgi:HEAT repeat protein
MLTKRICSLVVGRSACLLAILSPCPLVCRGDFDEIIDSPMYRMPEPPAARVVMVFPEEALGLWLRALERPEADLKCKAADAIVRAHRRGVKKLETTIDPLLAELDRSGGRDLCSLIEPALARWDYRPARAVWLERLRKPATPPQILVLAIQSLAAVKERDAMGRLHEIVLSEHVSGLIRLEAARALGSLRTEGLEKDAGRLAADASTHGMTLRLAGAVLLRQHGSAEAIELLQRLTRDKEPSVAAIAVARLIEINPDLVVPAVEDLLKSHDANLRLFAVEVLHLRPTEKHVRLLSDRLNDVHPQVRVKARRRLRELAAKKELRDQVIAEATKMLATQQWRGVEQATILLTQLRHKPAGERLVELLRFDRPEVSVTAAWGLRKLAARDTLPGVVSFVREQLERPLQKEKAPSKTESVAARINDHRLSQLHQLLGQQKYQPAETVLRGFIPKSMNDVTGPESRAAAIWALGVIYEGTTVPALATLLEERLNDQDRKSPEDTRVRQMCAITLGRIKAKEALPSLRKNCPNQEPSENSVNNACGWAIAQITGEAMPAVKIIRKMQRDWFLTPLK